MAAARAPSGRSTASAAPFRCLRRSTATADPASATSAFDKASRQFFASDLDTGLIHRIGADGTLIDTFDHGVAGRPAHGLAAVADDGTVMDIQSAAFDSEDPDSWGFTQDERRVWARRRAWRPRSTIRSAIKPKSGRSASTTTAASPAMPRWELTVKADQDYPVTDIAFDSRGFMYLAQRGDIENRYDYSQFADSGKGEVLRYWRESPDDPATREHLGGSAAGICGRLPAKAYRQAAGGLDLQYGYDDHGNLNLNACSDTLVKTGDRLRDNPALRPEQLAAGGPLAVHGVQITATSLVRPANEPPFGSWFVDFDGYFEDPRRSKAMSATSRSGIPAKAVPATTRRFPEAFCRRSPPVEKKVDLTMIKRAAHTSCGVDGVCDWDIFIVNSGTVTFDGPLALTDNYPTGAPTSSTFGPSPPWNCGPAGPGQYHCDVAGIVLVPGASARIGVRTTIPADYPAQSITSCAKVQPVPDESRSHQQRGLRRPARAARASRPAGPAGSPRPATPR